MRAVGDERSETEHRIPLLTGSAGEDVRSEKKFGITMMLTFPGQLQLGDVVASQKVESAWSQEGGGAGRLRAGREIDHHRP